MKTGAFLSSLLPLLTLAILTAQGAPGDLDTTFSGDGKVTTDVGAGADSAQDVAIQADGKIVVTGLVSNGSNFDFALVRYKTDGTLDSSFGSGGKVITPLGTGNDLSNALALQTDGKIIVVGKYRLSSGNDAGAVVRYNVDGTPDTSFGTDGIAVGALFIRAVVIQPNGKIVVAGDIDTVKYAVVQRFNGDGTQDNSFGSGSTTIISSGFGLTDQAYSVALQANGKIVVAGSVATGTPHFSIVRLNADGSFDSTFGTDGIVSVPIGAADTAYSVAVQTNGKIVAAGASDNDIAVVRLNANGTLDPSFDGDGIVKTNIIGSDQGFALALQPNGKIAVAGYASNITGSDFAVVTYNTDGSLDPDFGMDGIVQIDFGSTAEFGYALTLDGSGRLVVAGVSADLFAIARLEADFSGVVIAESALLNISTRMQVLTGDQVLIGGFIITGTDPKMVILRAIGPSLTDFGVDGALADPVLELRALDGSVIATNDNWTTDRSAIEATGLQPSKDLESAIVATLDPGAYTAIVSGKGGTTGVGLVEAYDLDTAAASELANISTRGFVATGSNVMIGGFILGSDANVLIRAIGPSLTDFGIVGALEDPTLELRDVQGTLLSSNDNWKDPNQLEIEMTGLQPGMDAESALLEALPAGAYTAIVAGVGGAIGVGLVEVYRLP